MTSRRLALALAATIAGPAASAEPADPLRFTVNPSGSASAARETPEQMLERRLRQADAVFRSICRGCGRHQDGLTEVDAGPFEPQRTLDRTRAGAPAPRVPTIAATAPP